MNFPKSSFDDELGILIERTLDRYVDRRGPSDDVWQKISEKLEGEAPAKAQRRRFALPAPAIQAASVVLAIFIGILLLRQPVTQSHAEPELIAQVPPVRRLHELPEMDLPSGRTVSAKQNPVIVLDAVDIHDLKLYQRTRTVVVHHPAYPAIIAPTDVMPHPLRLRSRIYPTKAPQIVAMVPKGSTQLRMR